nr:hypothetical protein [uncultured Acetatifactor sp.]
MALIKADIIMARQGIELYKSNEIKEVKNQAAYHLQQAAEKMIKIQIYRSGVPYENKSLYVHNLKVLIHYAELLDFGVRIPDFIRKNALIISDWEASSRYDIHFTIKYPAASNGVFDPRGIRQMCMQACPLDSLLAGIKITSLEKCYKEVTSWYDELSGTGIK